MPVQPEQSGAMSNFQAMLSSTPLAAGNAPYVEALYEQFLAAPDSVEPKWRDFFAGLGGGQGEVAHGPLIEELARRAKTRRPGAVRPRRSSCRVQARPRNRARSRG
jgi:2-oxoglutarate dehydrogenase complex dehydrogenase (E1) component-like enzyme